MKLSIGQGSRSGTGRPGDVARAVVDLILDLLEALRGDGREVMSFREILPDQTVVILHTAFFPRTVEPPPKSGRGIHLRLRPGD